MIGYIDTYGNGTERPIFLDDSIDQGTSIRTKDGCYTVSCSADGLKLSSNQCQSTTSPPSAVSNCSVVEYGQAPLTIRNGQCVSRESVSRERCGGACLSDSDEQCRCCSIGSIYSQSVTFDCLIAGDTKKTEEKIIAIQRIKSCQCDACAARVN